MWQNSHAWPCAHLLIWNSTPLHRARNQINYCTWQITVYSILSPGSTIQGKTHDWTEHKTKCPHALVHGVHSCLLIWNSTPLQRAKESDNDQYLRCSTSQVRVQIVLKACPCTSFVKAFTLSRGQCSRTESRPSFLLAVYIICKAFTLSRGQCSCTESRPSFLFVNLTQETTTKPCACWYMHRDWGNYCIVLPVYTIDNCTHLRVNTIEECSVEPQALNMHMAMFLFAHLKQYTTTKQYFLVYKLWQITVFADTSTYTIEKHMTVHKVRLYSVIAAQIAQVAQPILF